jgi:hypothetical protein
MKNHIKTKLVILTVVLTALGTGYPAAECIGAARGNPSIQEVRAQKMRKKQQRLENIKKLEKKLQELKNYSFEELQLALTVKAFGVYEGASVMSDQRPPVYLGLIADEFHPESIFNTFERYGSEFNPMSIWNPFGTYGSSYSHYSPFNMFAQNPPLVVKDRKILGRLTINGDITGGIDPNWLKLFFRY